MNPGEGKTRLNSLRGNFIKAGGGQGGSGGGGNECVHRPPGACGTLARALSAPTRVNVNYIAREELASTHVKGVRESCTWWTGRAGRGEKGRARAEMSGGIILKLRNYAAPQHARVFIVI